VFFAIVAALREHIKREGRKGLVDRSAVFRGNRNLHDLLPC
jgi:hypothetical protein